MGRRARQQATHSLAAVLLLASIAIGCSTGDQPRNTSSTVMPTVPSPTTTPPGSTATTSATSTVVETREPPYFETGPCATEAAYAMAAVLRRDVDCGHLVVLEDRSRPDGTRVRLPVVVARTRNPDPQPDPVIYLAGGGGFNHLRYADRLMESVGTSIIEDRDFIQYNQRGAPLTTPDLRCPGYPEFLVDLASQPLQQREWQERNFEFVSACRDAVIDTGVDLSMYNSATNAADADELRRALGYEQANYYGTSYGTRLGLNLIRDHPDGVRSIVLDSVYPPQAGFYAESGANLQAAFEYLFSQCAADEDCATSYPDLEASFFATIERLDADPEPVESFDGPILVDGGIFMDAASLLLYSPGGINQAPGAIARAANGEFSWLRGPITGAVTSADISWVMWYAMQCREEIPFESLAEAIEIGTTLHPGVAAHYTTGFASFHFALCERWGSEPADAIESLAVTSTVPALVLAGSYDPVTPPTWGASTADALPNAFYLEFPHVGHGVMRSTDCGLSIGLQFLADPLVKPDSSCIGNMAPPSFSQ